MATTLLDPPSIEQATQEEPKPHFPAGWQALFLLLVTLTSIVVNGYHPYSEDAAIYVQVIKKKLDPSLYLHGSQFFLPHAKLSFFPLWVARSIALSHIRPDYGLLLWHIFTIGLLLAACWRFCELCFNDKNAPVYGTLLVGAALTLPIAGTSLFLADPYLTSRSLSTPALLFAICFTVEKKFVRGFLWFACALLVHPLMAAYGGLFLLLLTIGPRRRSHFFIFLGAASATVVLIARQYGKGLYISSNYRAAALTRSYFFLSEWQWYEIFGLFAPLALFAWLWWARRGTLDPPMRKCVTATLWYGSFFIIVGFGLIRTPALIGLGRFQPMRSFHLFYILLLLVPVNIAVQRLCERRPFRFALLLGVVCAIIFMADRQSFPASPHVEWPWMHSQNDWRQSFDWIRVNTPKDAVFALSPDYMNQPGEDHLGFRAYAERNSLADRSKDGGVAAIFPALADAWGEETNATAGLDQVQNDMQAAPLVKDGVSWIVLPDRSGAGLDCPYRNHTVAVCRLHSKGLWSAE